MKQLKIMDVKLGDLKPNPYKKQIREGKLESGKIAKLMGSIHDNGFWNQLQLTGTIKGETTKPRRKYTKRRAA